MLVEDVAKVYSILVEVLAEVYVVRGCSRQCMLEEDVADSVCW